MLKIGISAITINPPEGALLSGYPNPTTRKNAGVDIDLRTKALYLEDGSTKLMLITTDLSGVSFELVNRLRGKICDRTGVGKDNIMVSASHTHSAPITRAWGEVTVDQD